MRKATWYIIFIIYIEDKYRNSIKTRCKRASIHNNKSVVGIQSNKKEDQMVYYSIVFESNSVTEHITAM